MAEFVTKGGERLLIEYDDCEVVVSREDGTKVGAFLFKKVEVPNGYSHDYHLHLCHMDLHGYKGQGIGRRCIEVAREQSGMEMSASDPFDTEEKEDGSHLIGDGPAFVTKMQEEGLIMGGDSPDDDDC